MKILLLSDSRGVHRPAGASHQLYTTRLAQVPGLQVTSLLCPFQWTTIPDFLHVLEAREAYHPSKYDRVILHAGIVDHSPRPLQQMLSKLYAPAAVTDHATVEELFRTRKFSNNKIVNRKKPLLDGLFSEAEMLRHFGRPFAEEYEGDRTINLYSPQMMLERIVPRLRQIDNLLFIGSNDFARGWNGDFGKERPSNIFMIEEYSRLLCQALPAVVNLHQWSPQEVMKFTCDNLHLSAEGSEWIFLRVLEELGLRPRDYLRARRTVGAPARETAWPLRFAGRRDDIASIEMTSPVVLQKDEVAHLQRTWSGGGKLATLIIGVRLKEADASREENLAFLLKWIEKHYPGLFDVLIVEQDKEPTADFRERIPGEYRYEFLYNPEAYNRGWLYNVAVRHFTDNEVVAFCDTDILPGGNFLDCIVDCHGDFDAVSPNRNLFYSTEEQKRSVIAKGSHAGMEVDAAALKNPTSLSGGMLVFNRRKFLEIGGFEQYMGYGCEDRALDVTMLALLPPSRVRMDSQAYFHLHHPISTDERAYFADIYAHMVENYGCEWNRGLGVTDYIHKGCCHVETGAVERLAEIRRASVGDPAMYRRHSYLTVNGLPPVNQGKLIRVAKPEAVFPPNFTTLRDYHEKEEFLGRYAAGWAPPVPKELAGADTEELEFFYNRFKGKRCFIIGNGPSLNKIDLSLLKGEYTFAVNSFYYKTRETGFRPTFFVVEDSSVIKENQEEIVSYEAPFKFFPSIYKSLHPKRPGTYFFKINRGFYEKASPNYAIPRFSTDITKGAFCGQSVTYVNLQLAFYMGFTEVFLIGMDFNYEIPESHKRTGDVLLSDTDDPNHFHKDYFGKGKTWKDPKLDRVLMNYQMADLVYRCAGRRIYNATVGGKLEAFERVEFEGLFRGRDPSFRSEPLDLARPPAPSVQAASVPPPAPPAPAAPPKAVAVPDSIAEAHRLYDAGRYQECSAMCNRLFEERGLRMYRHLAERAAALGGNAAAKTINQK